MGLFTLIPLFSCALLKCAFYVQNNQSHHSTSRVEEECIFILHMSFPGQPSAVDGSYAIIQKTLVNEGKEVSSRQKNKKQ